MTKEALSIYDTLKLALEAYIKAGIGNSTDFVLQNAAYDLAVEALSSPNGEAQPVVTESHKLMLEALIWADAKGENWEKAVSKAIRVAQEALSSPNGEAQPEQRNVSEHLEPVTCVTYKEVADTMNGLWGGTIVQRQIAEELENTMLYTTPYVATPRPQRTWVGLTDDERNSLYAAHHNKYYLPNQGSPDGMDYERAIEAKLMEKNT